MEGRRDLRPIVAAVVAVTALAIAAVVAIVVATSVVPGAPAVIPSAPPPAAVVAPPQPPPARASTPDLEAMRRELLAPKPPPMPPPDYGTPPPRPPEASWEAVTISPRASALGPIGGALGRELNELQPKLSACFDEDTQARHGQQPLTIVKDAAPMDDAGATILVLQVEERGGELQIVDAPVETHGGASDGLIACAQRVLRGHSVAAPQARPGNRHRVLFTLLQ